MRFRDVANFRDLGGYPAADGRRVKHGLIWRSAGPYTMDRDELAALLDAGLAYVLDLRTAEEAAAKPDPELPGVEMVRHSGVVSRGGEEIDFSPTGMHRLGDGARDQFERLTSYYREMPFGNEAFHVLMDRLEQGRVPLLFHCATGKDRTGVAAMVVLAALGIPRETIMADYLASNDAFREKLDLVFAEHAEDAEDPVVAKLLQMESGVLEEIGECVLDSIEERCGSFDAYIADEYGISGERLSAFRDKYLEQSEAAGPGLASSARTILAAGRDCPSGAVPQASYADDCLSTEGQVPSLAAELASEARPRRLRLLFTSDVHGAVTGRSYVDGSEEPGGFARLATLIGKLRDADTLVIDGGDTLEGSPLSSYHARHRLDEPFPATLAMAAAGYDFELLGNHDFNFGREVFERHLALCGAGSLTGNAVADGAPLAPPYAIREIAGLRVALIGATTSAIPRWELPANIEGMDFVDAFEHVRAAVSEARANENPDLVIVAYHGGFERDPETDEPFCDDDGENQAWRMLREVEGIDVLLTGHQHRTMCGVALGPDGREVAYVQPGSKGVRLACVDVDVEDRSALPVLIEVDGEADADVLALVAEEDGVCQTWLDQPLGTSLVDLSVTDTLEAELEKSQLVTFLNLVQLEATGAELSATAIFPGATGFGREITMRDLVSTYRFANTLAVKRVSGAQLRSYLERCAEYFVLDSEGRVVRAPASADPPADFNYDMVDGVDYTIDLTREPGERIVELTRNGRPVKDGDSFTLAVNSYRAVGGGGFPMIAAAPTVAERLTDMVELIADYILGHSPVDFEPVCNIRIVTEKE